MTTRRCFSTVTFTGLMGSLVLSALWFAAVQGVARYEPAVNGLLVFAALLGLYAEPRAAAQQEQQMRQQERRLVLQSVRGELHANAALLRDQRFAAHRPGVEGPKVYPRLGISAVDHALVSGRLTELDEVELRQALYGWRYDADDFNRRLTLTEQVAFSLAGAGQSHEFEAALHRSDGYFDAISGKLADLREMVERTTDAS